MIIAGFTGQLKGWWDNYLTQEQRSNILNAVKREGTSQEPVIVPNAVYSLVINIIEHFSGRWSDNNETIRTMLQNLRCQTLTSFRWYKDEGLALCNEIKLNQQIKRHGLNERQQLGEFCGQFGMNIPQTKAPHRRKKKKKDFQAWKEKRLQKKARRKKEFKKRKDYVKSKNPKACYKCGRVGHFYKNYKVKEKIKNLDIDDDLKESLYKILLNSEPEDSDFEFDNSEDSSSNEDPS
ncbi:uncharacterized protein LOC132061224 [Lycium ferocissimum]|uniref:uncharacterized protein LOC132061224 n=1 Tax=Lycium ferocissimum TaxID=112874 RepID=UPI002814BD8B|nr:uncharacterized protein LOC132061224 [Lycium ferocissimum]